MSELKNVQTKFELYILNLITGNNNCNQIMLKSLFLFLSFVLGICPAQVKLYITCQPCTISCSYSSCYKISADGFSHQQCGYTNCSPTSLKLNIVAKKCADASCKSNICLSEGVFTSCSTTTSCSRLRWIYQSCGNCSSQLNCDRCIIATSNDFPGESKMCSNTCINKTPLNTSSLQCSLLAQQSNSGCQCCILQTGFEGNFEYGCSSNNIYFSSTKIENYLAGKLFLINICAQVLMLTSILFLSL